MELINRFLQPIMAYPAATGIHWLLCAVAGFLVQHSSNHGGEHSRYVSVSMLAMFVAYEISEFARIHDTVELDIMQGFAAYLLAVFGTWAYHKWRIRNA